jgi:hypothetical protein
MYKLLEVTILPLHGIHDEVSSSLPISMHQARMIAIPSSWEVGMAIL